jgi:putative transposase
MDKFKQKYRIPSTRLQSWDYGSSGLYFVTICTKRRELYFGDIIASANTQHPNNVETQNFASPFDTPKSEVQNNHTNQNASNTETQNFGSLRTVIGKIADEYWLKIPDHFPFVELDEYVIMPNHLHGILFLNKPDHKDWQPNKFGAQSKNLGSIIR